MTDDISAIPTTGCNYISSPTVIYNYNNNIRRTYKAISGKWFFTEQTTYTQIPNSYQCSDISSISSFSYMMPIYAFIAFVLSVCVLSAVWLSYRRLIKWRV